jgi:Domain of unknown function (DUF1905)
VTATRYEFDSELFEWDARREKWVFAALPDDVSADIRDVPRPRKGFDSVRVVVTLGASRWTTSVFPQGAEGPYVVPIRRAVRDAEGVDTGDRVRLGIETID